MPGQLDPTTALAGGYPNMTPFSDADVQSPQSSAPSPVPVPSISGGQNQPAAVSGARTAPTQKEGLHPKDWAMVALAGIQGAMQAFAKRPGPNMGEQMYQNKIQQDQLAQQKQQQQADLNLRQRTATREEQELAFRQAQAVREMGEHDLRMKNLGLEYDDRTRKLMEDEINWQQGQEDHEQSLLRNGARITQLGGVDTPAFDSLGQIENYATKNFDALRAASSPTGHIFTIRPVLGADNKYHLYTIPLDEANQVSKRTYVDANGQTREVYSTPHEAMMLDEQAARIRRTNEEANLDHTRAIEDKQKLAETDTVKAARRHLTGVKGDYSKLTPGEKDALRDDYEKRYKADYAIFTSGMREMQRDPRYALLPLDAQGRTDTSSEEYKELADEYHILEANENLSDEYNALKQLRYGYPNVAPARPVAPASPVVPAKTAPAGTPASVKPGQKLAVIVNGKIVGYSTDGGKTMVPVE